MISQKIAVVNTLLLVLKERGVDYEMGGEIILHSVLTKEDKSKVQTILLEGFLDGSINMTEAGRANNSTEVKMKSYVSGVVNNWVRKNPDFNNNFASAGGSYKPKNPGSRVGQKDETIKNLRLMKKKITDVKTLAEIDEAIAARLAEIKPESVVEVNVDAIPEHLKYLVGKTVKIGESTSELEEETE